MLRFANPDIGRVAQRLNAVASVKRHSNLLVSVDEALQLRVQLDVLAGEDVAVVLEGVDFGAAITVLGGERLHLEAEIVLLTPLARQVVIRGPILGLKVVQVG